MNWFDFTIIRLVTSFANVWPAFDRFVNFLLGMELVKGGVTMSLFWAAWLGQGSDERRREVLAATLAAAAVALGMAMALALLLPFRLRPMLAYQTEGMVVPPSWREWSAFPSDHATLFFALATGLVRASPILGWLALAHALVVVCLPRVYLGVHYPTDIVGGAVIGIVISYLFVATAMRQRIARWPLAQMKRRPGLFYAALFVLTYLIATLFTDLRTGGRALHQYLLQ
jgi:undecaprenyl-diphosphatase